MTCHYSWSVSFILWFLLKPLPLVAPPPFLGTCEYYEQLPVTMSSRLLNITPQCQKTHHFNEDGGKYLLRYKTESDYQCIDNTPMQWQQPHKDMLCMLSEQAGNCEQPIVCDANIWKIRSLSRSIIMQNYRQRLLCFVPTDDTVAERLLPNITAPQHPGIISDVRNMPFTCMLLVFSLL